jgi:hypothetical protein
MKVIKSGVVKRIHVDKHVLANNRKTGATDAPIKIQTSKGSVAARWAYIWGSSVVMYPEKPLKCGATVYVETYALVEYEP